MAKKKPRGTEVITTDRLIELLSFDKIVLKEQGGETPTILVGTDEVGRGCLAGPVMAAAVILPAFRSNSALAKKLAKLDDSKKLPAAIREQLAETLKENCQFAIAEASVEEIDEINILHASLLAMGRAVTQLSLVAKPIILIDGNKKITTVPGVKQITVIDGDAKSATIAAASVIAKTYRDAFMRKLSEQYPHYKWESNKGYGSQEHRQAIEKHGLCKWHRRKFVQQYLESDQEQQLVLPLNNG